jgi:cobalt-zinc-cadmium efflux system outer membrane protein
MPDTPSTPLIGDLQAGLGEITFDSALERLLTNSPELTAAQAHVNRARQATARARAEAIPNVDFQAGVQHDNATGDEIANVQVGLPLPIWNRNQGGIRRAEAELATARNEIQRVELNLQHRLASAYRRYANARQQAAIYREQILPDAQTSLDLVTTGYRQGEFGYLTLLTSQRTYFQTNLAYLEALRELRESAVAIDGLLLTDSLTASEQRDGQNN